MHLCIILVFICSPKWGVWRTCSSEMKKGCDDLSGKSIFVHWMAAWALSHSRAPPGAHPTLQAVWVQTYLYSLEPGSQARFGLTLARWMAGNHLEKYIVPTSLVSPQVPAFVIIHELVMLEYRKTTRRYILMESYFSTLWLKTYAVLADILIGSHLWLPI